jgi:hypothetical protein
MREYDPDHFSFPRQSGLSKHDFKEEPWFKLDLPTAICLILLIALITSIALGVKFTDL